MRRKKINGISEFDIYHACLYSDVQFIKGLVESSIDIANLEVNDNPILNMACVGGNLEIIRMLVERGCNINATNEHLSSPLYVAHVNNRVEIEEYLISCGADIIVAAKGDEGTLEYFATVKESADLKKKTKNVDSDNENTMGL